MNLLLGIVCVLSYGRIVGETNWQNMKTRHTVIHYNSMNDLKKLNKNIRFPSTTWNAITKYFNSDADMVEEKLVSKVDILFERVQEILGMHNKLDKTKIFVCQNKAQLREIYQKFYKKPCRLRAFYIYEFNAIYINVQDLNEGILSHEMAHSIISNFSMTRPPVPSTEILAQYVNKHLFR